MNYWKPQHEVFIRCMLKHEDPAKAYRAAYPKARPASARVGGYRLYSYPHIRQRIEPIIKERRAEAHRKAVEEGAERERRAQERRMEIRQILYKVMMKQLRKKRTFIINGQTVTAEEDPATGTILNALTLDLRLEAGYDNWPAIERRFARIMASLQPREKREQTVINSLANSIQAIVPADKPNTALLQNKTPKLPSLAKEGTLTNEQAHLSAGVVEKPGISTTAEERNAVVQKREHSVTILQPKPIQERPAHHTKTVRITRVVTKKHMASNERNRLISLIGQI